MLNPPAHRQPLQHRSPQLAKHSKVALLTEAMHNGHMAKPQAYRDTLHSNKQSQFDKRLHTTLQAASASSMFASAAEHNRLTKGRLRNVQHRYTDIRELQD